MLKWIYEIIVGNVLHGSTVAMWVLLLALLAHCKPSTSSCCIVQSFCCEQRAPGILIPIINVFKQTIPWLVICWLLTYYISRCSIAKHGLLEQNILNWSYKYSVPMDRKLSDKPRACMEEKGFFPYQELSLWLSSLKPRHCTDWATQFCPKQVQRSYCKEIWVMIAST
jgi:hypothetical protein